MRFLSATLDLQPGKGRRGLLTWRGPVIRPFASWRTKSHRAASTPLAQDCGDPAEPAVLDRLVAHDGSDLGLVVVTNECDIRRGVQDSDVPKVLLADLHESNSLVVRKIVLKRYEPIGASSTGLEPEHWKRAAKCVDFVLPYLGNVRHRMAHYDETHLWLVSPYTLPLDQIISGGETAQYRPYLHPDRVLRYVRHTFNRTHGFRLKLTQLRQLLSGLQFLHKVSRLVHCDFKPDNIFVTETFDAVIGDFGISRKLDKPPDELETSQVIRSMGSQFYLSPETTGGTIAYAGSSLPEVYDDDPPRPTTPYIPPKLETDDIWAFGILVLHIYSRALPFKGPAPEQGDLTYSQKIREGRLPSYPGHAARARGLDFVLWRICRDCWSPIPRCRPTASQLLSIIQTHGDQILIPETIADLPDCMPDDITDLTAEIRVQPIAPDFSGPAGYARVKATWDPAEIAPRRVDVVLIRRDDSVDSASWSRSFIDELLKWRRLCHENLVPLLGTCTIDGVGYAVSPAYTQCDARSWLADEDQRSRRVPSADCNAPLLRLLLDITNALVFLHEQRFPIRHGNVHIDNVFVAEYPPAPKRGLTVNGCLGRFDRVRSYKMNDPMRVAAISEDVKMYGSLFCEVLRSRYQFPHNDLPGAAAGLRMRCEADIRLVHTIYRDAFVCESPTIEMSVIAGYLGSLLRDAVGGRA